MPDDVPFLDGGRCGALLPTTQPGSSEDWGELLERFRVYLLLVANEELDTDLQAKLGASDLVQETLLEAHQGRNEFRGGTYGELLAWLRQILLNNLANYRRHYQQTGKRRTAREFSLDADGSVSGFNVELADDTTSPSGKAIEKEEAAALQGALDRLPDDYRQVLILRNREQKTFTEIGSQMNRSADAARMLWYRSFERLVSILEQRMQTDFLNDWMQEYAAAQSMQREAIPDGPDGGVVMPDERLRVAKKYLNLLERVWPTKEPSIADGDGARSPPDDGPLPPMESNSSTLQLPMHLGHYRITRVLGGGGQGIVYQAFDTVLRRQVALKVPRAKTLASPPLRRRFLRKAQAVAALSHSHLIAVYEAGAWYDICYIASAYCEGPNLSQWLKQQQKPLSVRLAVRLVATVADTVDYIHRQGIVHRDLKPSNVLLESLPNGSPHLQAPDSIGYTPKLTDFGLAKLLSAPSDTTATGEVLGTPAYMAPEQASGRVQQIGVATDVYGLGVILYELLTGTTPKFEQVEGSARQSTVGPAFSATVPQPLRSICRRCLEFDPGRRYQSARALATDLERFLAGKPVARLGWSALASWTAVTAALAGLCIIVVALGIVLSRKPTPGQDVRAGRDSPVTRRIAAAGSIEPLITLLEEDWEQQKLGDESDDLLQWRGPAGRGLDHPSVHTIVAANGNLALLLDASASQTGKPYLGSVPEKPYLPFLAGEMLSARFDAQLSGVPGQLVFVIAHFLEGSGYQLLIDDKRQAIELVRLTQDKSMQTLGTTGAGQFHFGQAFHTFELRALLKEDGIEFQVATDNRLLFAVSDADPMLTNASTVRFQFQVNPRRGNGQPGKVALLDNIRVAAGARMDFPPLAE